MGVSGIKPYYYENGITIYNADCRELLPILPGASVDLVLTDPPYGHNNNNGTDLIGRIGLFRGKEYNRGSKSKGRPIANDGAEANDLVRWMFGEAKRLLKPGCCCCCCCGGGGPDPQFARWSLWLDEAIGFKQMVVWDKGGLGMGWHYRRNYETVLVAEKPGEACKWYGGHDVANVIRLTGIKPSADDHPTPKPVELMQRFVMWHTQPGDVVLDPFMGGGTTLVAAKALARKAIGIEVDERWCELAVKRLSQQTLNLEVASDESPEQGKLAV